MIKGRRNIDFPSALYYNHRAGVCPEQSFSASAGRRENDIKEY